MAKEKTRKEHREERVARLRRRLVVALTWYRKPHTPAEHTDLACNVARYLDALDTETGIASKEVPHDRS